MTGPTPGDRVVGDRLLDRLRSLARIGADAAGGVSRLAYSDDDVRARDVVAGWLSDAGAVVTVDAAGNLIGEIAGSSTELPVLATGSHLDTVLHAGAFDGAYGVVAAVEVLTRIAESPEPLRHPVRAVAFSNEEGARGTPGMVGSHAIAGLPVDLARADDVGVPLHDRIAAAGGDPAAFAGAAWTVGTVAAFFELHVEQGPVLEDSGHSIGVVTGVTGRANVEVRVQGEARHAGTTPMAARRDAAVAAAHVVLAVDRIARDGTVRVATTGRIGAAPGVRNVVPGAASLSVELRDDDEERISRGLHALEVAAAEIARLTGCGVEVVAGPLVASTPTDPCLRACVRDAAGALGLSSLAMPSGAGHDAQIVAAIAPVALAFVPSRAGISHAPEEHTDDADLVAGADVLYAAIRLADGRLDADRLFEGAP